MRREGGGGGLAGSSICTESWCSPSHLDEQGWKLRGEGDDGSDILYRKLVLSLTHRVTRLPSARGRGEGGWPVISFRA